MKNVRVVVEEILKTLKTIEKNYPELAQHLEDSPIKMKNNPGETDFEALTKYKNSLVGVYNRYVEHKSKKRTL
ncbi:MAG: hypothetical protein LAT76_04655 [Schleiferiaceae bacterium]|nr:hypothetical protein [Schleiferiaceae bacterium]